MRIKCGLNAEMTQRTFGHALGELIFQKRMAAGLSQLQLSEDAFGSAAKTRRISELETGSVAQPHLKTINPIINALGITDAEIEACAKQAVEAIDPDLDRAFREARNLLDALAAQFEHARPEATLPELDDFLRAKAREWRSLRDRISEIEGLDEIISALKVEAAEALANGEFERVDEVLALAEQQHQESRTLKEVRSQALIRISRGDAALLGEKLDVALQHYNAAVQFFAPFDEHEMVAVAQHLAARVYEDSRRSLNPTFSVASGVLVPVWKTQTVEQDDRLRAAIAYRLGLIFRNHYLSRFGSPDHLDDALKYSRHSVEYDGVGDDLFGTICMKIGLANCLVDKSKRDDDHEAIHESIELLRAIQADIEGSREGKELLAHVCNSLGSALLTSRRWNDDKADDSILEAAFQAFIQTVAASEASSDAETWGAAKANIGGVLAEQSKAADLQPFQRAFLKIRAIAEFSSALETFPEVAFPYKYADTHQNLARVLVDYATTDAGPLTEFYLFRSLQSFEAAAVIYNREIHLLKWVELQNLIGAVILFHARMEGVQTQEHDYARALEAYKAAHDASLGHVSEAETAACRAIIEQIQSEMAAYQPDLAE
jgi:transcriptional regulator with XRE-family HTH domain